VGGTGYIGGHLAEYFFREGEISKAVFRKGSHLRILDQCGIQLLEADLLDKHSLHEALEMVNAVYNLASPTPDHGEQVDYLKVNTEGLRNLLEEAEEHGVKDFVHLSTLDVFGFNKKRIGNGENVSGSSSPPRAHPYQRAKLQAETVIQEFLKKGGEMRVKVVRAAKSTGPRDTTLALPILRMMESGNVVITGGDSALSFTHPKDVAKALFKAATAQGEGGTTTFQVKSFDSTAEDLARGIVEACGKKSQVKREGVFSKTPLPPYAANQLRSGMFLEKQDSWDSITYSPDYDLGKTCQEIAEWHGKEPWLTERT
jgi:nucleoside-diphosphate-sugar epimerase